MPHDGEVGRAGKVLSDGDRRVQVEDHVPPAACRRTDVKHQHQTENKSSCSLYCRLKEWHLLPDANLQF